MDYPKLVLHQAVHNRPEYTELSIRSIGQRTLWPNFDWVVSAIACDPQTTGVLDDLRREFGFSLQTYTQNVGQWAACQKAWDMTTAPLLSHIQNDILVPWAWVHGLFEGFEAFKPFLIGAFHFGIHEFPKRDEEHPNGIGICYVSHIAGTAFLLHRDDWYTYGRIATGHPIYGFTQYQAQAAKRGAKIGYMYPPVKITHMDENGYPFSLRETTYKEETDRIFMLRHGKARQPNQWP